MTENAKLKQFIHRIERLDEDRIKLVDDIKCIYDEAKGHGFDPKIMRKVVNLRKIDRDKRNEEQELVKIYLENLGE